jgi:hypothetical protein
MLMIVEDLRICRLLYTSANSCTCPVLIVWAGCLVRLCNFSGRCSVFLIAVVLVPGSPYVKLALFSSKRCCTTIRLAVPARRLHTVTAE